MFVPGTVVLSRLANLPSMMVAAGFRSTATLETPGTEEELWNKPLAAASSLSYAMDDELKSSCLGSIFSRTAL